jgi:hypothetical protein
MSFYLYLPSNVSPRYFANNRISRFKVKLPKRLTFEPEEYEVAATEFTYVNSIKTDFSKDDRRLYVHELSNSIDKPNQFFAWLPDQNYSSVKTMISNLNEGLRKSDGESLATFTYNEETNQVEMKTLRGEFVASQKLCIYLGFDDKLEDDGFGNLVRTFPQGSYIATLPPDPGLGMNHLFIYCDIIQEQIVGDSMVPLLRMLNISQKKDQVITETFRPYYLPLSRLDFDTIEVLLCNEFGEEVTFSRGQATVTLHFRKCKN